MQSRRDHFGGTSGEHNLEWMLHRLIRSLPSIVQEPLMKYFSNLVAKLCPTLATPQTVAYGVPLSMGFSRQEYWSGKALTKSRSEPRVTEHISKALLGHPLWGCLLDIMAPACLSPADQVTSLLGSCSTATTYSLLDFLFSTRPVGMKAPS